MHIIFTFSFYTFLQYYTDKAESGFLAQLPRLLKVHGEGKKSKEVRTPATLVVYTITLFYDQYYCI